MSAQKARGRQINSPCKTVLFAIKSDVLRWKKNGPLFRLLLACGPSCGPGKVLSHFESQHGKCHSKVQRSGQFILMSIRFQVNFNLTAFFVIKVGGLLTNEVFVFQSSQTFSG